MEEPVWEATGVKITEDEKARIINGIHSALYDLREVSKILKRVSQPMIPQEAVHIQRVADHIDWMNKRLIQYVIDTKENTLL